MILKYLPERIIRDTYRHLYVRRHFNYYYKVYNKDYDRNNFNFKLPSKLKKDYISYYRSFGFKHVFTSQIELIYALTGKYDRRIISDELLNLYIDPIFPEKRDFWQNKAYQKDIIKFDDYPNTILRNVNGYYLDNDDKIISEDIALDKIRPYERVVVKPSIYTGGGYQVRFFAGKEFNKSVFDSYGKDFIVQEKLKQSPFMESFNSSSVNTIKIFTFLFKGNFHILTSMLRVGPEKSEKDNITAQPGGYRVFVNNDGRLSDFGYDGKLNKIYKTRDGRNFSDIVIPNFKECLEVVKKGHSHLLYFPYVGWDVALDENNKPVLIEYNLKYNELFDFQLLSGPIFGDLTEDVLKEAVKSVRKSKSLFYR